MKKCFNHDIYLKFKEGTLKQEIDEMYSQVGSLEKQIPVIISIKISKSPCKLGEKDYDGMFSIKFKKKDDEKKYENHPKHVPVSELIQRITLDIGYKGYLN